MTCQKAQGFLGQGAVAVAETVDATKVRYAAADALKLLDGVATLVAAKGKRLEVFDLKTAKPDDAVLLAHLLGPTGNLRAPTARVGAVLVVGFGEEAYRRALG
ncbi:MAG: hypothetical protein C0501_16805 [Isosphaera sp.]|nr:hypothetical protein [Isosphaera sp.]